MKIINGFLTKQAFSQETAIYLEDLSLPESSKLQYYLVEELVRSGFVRVLDNGKIYFLKKKWEREKIISQSIYLLIMALPLIIGTLMIIL